MACTLTLGAQVSRVVRVLRCWQRHSTGDLDIAGIECGHRSGIVAQQYHAADAETRRYRAGGRAVPLVVAESQLADDDNLDVQTKFPREQTRYPTISPRETMSSEISPTRTQAPRGLEAVDRAWRLLRALADRRRAGAAPWGPAGYAVAEDGGLSTVDCNDRAAQAVWDEQGLRAAPNQPLPFQDLIALYAPLFPTAPEKSAIVAHLGQSIDAQIATHSGDSCSVNGPANIVHLHRMRALCDAVIVGAGTAIADNPRLTTRLVEGDNPVRVVIDPMRRAPLDLGLFNDGAAPSLVVCAAERVAADEDSVIGASCDGDGLALSEVVAALRTRGLRTLFVEGGGITVSRWMNARLLDRLQVTVAPVLIGEGRRALQLPAAPSMSACRRPPARIFRLGDDVLWDFDLHRDDRQPAAHPDEQAFWPRRVI
jgi:riboflavin-specific deaminase-like protein